MTEQNNNPEQSNDNEPVYLKSMRKMARAMDIVFNGPNAGTDESTVGFLLFVFPLVGTDTQVNAMGNLHDDDVLEFLKSYVEQMEKQDAKS